VRPLLLAAGLGLIWFAGIQEGGVEGDLPAWGIAVVLAVRLLVDVVAAWVVVSVLRLAVGFGWLGVSYLRSHRQPEI